VSRALVACGVLALSAPPSAVRAQSRELNVVPIAGGDSDIGVGAGLVGDWAALAAERPPYRWRLEVSSFVTFKLRAGNRLVLPFDDEWLELVVPRSGPGGRLRVDARLAFTDEQTLKYTGIGNASPPLAQGLPVEDGEYQRLHPTASLEVRARVSDHVFVLAGTAFTYNRLTVAPGTVLAMDRAAGPPEVRRLLGDLGPHGVELLTAEAQYDTRDDEIVTRQGQFHTLRVRVSPRLGSALPYQYERVTLTSRVYRTSLARKLTFAGRLVGDVLLGSPPFYELARFDETTAIGGGKAVRGVPAQRYYGKVKTFGNLEVTMPIWWFTLRSKPLVLGLAAFLDGGRTWTELGHAHPELDGTGLGLKYGVGGGLRLQEGRTFLLRLDVAWSPDARPIGAYFAAGQIF
jgi:hypothetical protein